MLEYEKIPGASQYEIQLVQDAKDASFNKPLIDRKDSSTATLVEGLHFGKNYQWRYAGIVNGKLTEWKGPYRFEIMENPFSDRYRVKILQNDPVNSTKGLIALDVIRTIVDMKGTPVLFFPEGTDVLRRGAEMRDLTLNKAGTLTFLDGQIAGEAGLSGDPIWFAPLQMKSRAFTAFGDFYHHDIKRLPNGHYMILAGDYELKTLPSWISLTKVLQEAPADNTADSTGEAGRYSGLTVYINKADTQVLVNMEAINEYDKEGKTVWTWKCKGYFHDSDVFPENFDLNKTCTQQLPHLNAFSVDAKNDFVYASFRNIDRVVKIDKRRDKVVYSWGTKMATGEANAGDGFFKKQHGVNILKDGTIAVFNNGDTSIKSVPSSVVIFTQPSSNAPSKVIWKFDCDFDSSGLPAKRNTHEISVRGGNVDVISEQNFLVGMGAVNRVFEVSRAKKVVWSAVIEKKAGADSGWVAQPLYRAHYSSSLYPCYFTIQSNKDTIGKQDSTFSLKIFNEGTENDSYSVTISSPSNAFNKVFVTSDIKKGASAVLKLSRTAVPANNETVELKVLSTNNPDFVRKLQLSYLVNR